MSATTLSSSSAQTSQQTQSRATSVWRWLAVGYGAITLIALMGYLMLGFQFLQRPFLGMMVTHTMVVNNGDKTGDTVWPALESGIVRGDIIVGLTTATAEMTRAADSTAFRDDYVDFVSVLQTASTNAPVTIDFMRDARNAPIDLDFCERVDNNSALCSMEITPITFPALDFLSYYAMPMVSAFLIFLIGAALVRLRSDNLEGLLATVIAFASVNFAAGIFDIGTDGGLAPVWLMSAPLLGAALVTLGMHYPKRLRMVRTRPFLSYIPIGLSLLLGGYLSYQYLFPETVRSFQSTSQIATTVAALGIIGLLATMFIQRERANLPVTRDQSNTIFISVMLMFIPMALWIASRYIVTETSLTLVFNLESLMPLLILPNAGIAYAVLQYRYFDPDRVISQGVTYAIMGGALIVAVYLLSLGGTLIAVEGLVAPNIDPLPIAIIIFVMVSFFTPVRNRLQERIDVIYFRQRRNYQTIVEDFGRRLTTMDDYSEIVKIFQRTVMDALSPSSLFIFIYDEERGYIPYLSRTSVQFGHDSAILDLLRANNAAVSLQAGREWPHELWSEKSRLQLLKATLIKGMRTTDTINGFIVLGQPRVRDIYNHDDVRFVENIVNQLAIATERSRVIGSLERRVRELDVLSQVGQAVNFTIDFDDLLELIYAQTSKLIEVPNFYIALYEERIERLYFAFFLEGDDRVDSKENARWQLSNDLFSEIVKTAAPMRLEDYEAEIEKRGLRSTLVRGNLHGWMGVPLSAGRRTLGVMAAGKAKDRSEYTDEQYKIFTDIGALAATSLDKANLFTQTRMRERQLTVLNDISRQLVATESDVEKLLEIIMNSAVEILNAEAGSLLLTTDDDSGDLQFRVVIGGAGDELLNTRVSAGKGVVGEVVKTGEAKIVNDTSQDPTHDSGLVQDYISKSLLAVPLTAKDQVIGVLEVLNKKDGTPFVNEDADLLTTFSGQAAVAIENARLFQMTDLQLTERLRELEVLERLDGELNRTQDLEDVAEITVRSTMNILKADGGALGIVHKDTAVLEMVGVQGYEEDEYPEGADGNIWPLDKGIVGRVMRSRQADIALDVVMDPDYNNGLKGSNSQITLPMVSGDEIIAILILEKKTEPRFSLPDWAFAQRIAEHASIAIANAQFYEALLQANKSKSEFMGFAAHELKNPLASVKGYADVMVSGMTGDLSDQQKSFVQIIKSNAHRMQTIINDLRDAAQMESGEFSVNPAAMNIHHAVVETLRPYVKMLEDKGQELDNGVGDNLPLIWADETRVIQVLTNLVSNAHKYSPADTTIRITAEIVDNYHDRQGKSRGRMLRLAVIDQGLGISEEDQKRLFRERYFRSTNKEALEQPGTGLGMMLTKGIMDKHGGEIWLESALGEGTSFFISFPLAEDKQKKQEKPAITEPASD